MRNHVIKSHGKDIKGSKYNRGAENPPCNEPITEETYEIKCHSENRGPQYDKIFSSETEKNNYEAFIGQINLFPRKYIFIYFTSYFYIFILNFICE